MAKGKGEGKGVYGGFVLMDVEWKGFNLRGGKGGGRGAAILDDAGKYTDRWLTVSSCI